MVTLNENFSTTKNLSIVQSILPYASSLSEEQKNKQEGGLRIRGYYKKSLDQKPLITIITAVYNGEKYLEETIQSVINQTYDNVEYIIIDGGSTDKTLDILRNYEHALNYWISEKDQGIYDAWNKGIQHAHGEWIAFLGADDLYLSNAIEMYVNKIQSNQNAEYISSKVVLCDSNKKPLKIIGLPWDWEKFFTYMSVAHVGSLHHANLFKKYGQYDTNFKICGDYELLLRARNLLKTDFLNEQTCYMRTGGVSDANPKVFDETYRAKVLHNARSLNLISKLDMYIAMFKWKIRKVLHA